MSHPFAAQMRAEAALALSRPRADEDSVLFITAGAWMALADVVDAAHTLASATDPHPAEWDTLDAALAALPVEVGCG